MLFLNLYEKCSCKHIHKLNEIRKYCCSYFVLCITSLHFFGGALLSPMLASTWAKFSRSVLLFKSVNRNFIRSTTDLFQSIGMALRNLKSDDCSYISATECFSIV